MGIIKRLFSSLPDTFPNCPIHVEPMRVSAGSQWMSIYIRGKKFTIGCSSDEARNVLITDELDVYHFNGDEKEITDWLIGLTLPEGVTSSEGMKFYAGDWRLEKDIKKAKRGRNRLLKEARASGLPIYPPINDSVCGRCKTEQAIPDHTCPYAQEIHNDDKLCNCCDDCQYNCAMEI